jgi:hypothetical protein
VTKLDWVREMHFQGCLCLHRRFIKVVDSAVHCGFVSSGVLASYDLLFTESRMRSSEGPESAVDANLSSGI